MPHTRTSRDRQKYYASLIVFLLQKHVYAECFGGVSFYYYYFVMCVFFFIIINIAYKVFIVCNNFFILFNVFLCCFFSFFLYYCVAFMYNSVGVDVGLHWNRARYPNSFASNTMRIVSVANWKVSSIWINANRWIVACAWRIASKSFSICLILKRQSGRTIWQRIRKRICVIGWIVFVRCVICMIRSNHKVSKF